MRNNAYLCNICRSPGKRNTLAALQSDNPTALNLNTIAINKTLQIVIVMHARETGDNDL